MISTQPTVADPKPGDNLRKIPEEECTCDQGIVWNNADPTSGMFDECEACDWRDRR